MLFSLLYRMYTLNVNLKEMYVDDLIYSTFIKRYGGRKMKIIELPIEFEFNGKKQCIYPSLIILHNELTLVDTGYTNFTFN